MPRLFKSVHRANTETVASFEKKRLTLQPLALTLTVAQNNYILIDTKMN
jgi:hypothetical protein